MKLEVGMYVRDYEGEIGIIEELYHHDTYEHSVRYKYDSFLLKENDFVKASYNIIDLIEVGDFVEYKQSNMYWNVPTRVSGRYNRQQELTELMVGETPLKNVEITSVVTREEFESRKYIVGEQYETTKI